MSRDDFRRRADAVRGIPLEVVLVALDAERDPRDRSQWRTEKGPLTVTKSKFFNWHVARGGGGAIDLVIHLLDCNAAQAVEWLARHGRRHTTAPNAETRTLLGVHSSPPRSLRNARGPLRMPRANHRHLGRVRRYLHEQRALSLDLVDSLNAAGMLYADDRGNAVFVMVAGKPPRGVGTELRGTTTRVWHGLAPGTRRDAGYFWVGTREAKIIILCESAIDAISCHELHRSQSNPSLCISTAGVRSDAPWLPPLLNRGYTIYCGFDDDDAGNMAASQMMHRYSPIQRLTPPAHDWNDALKSSC
jgi:Toprim-like/Protein of unknown function (DUF3991)